MDGLSFGLIATAALIATAGTFWFRMVLKNWLLRTDTPLRFGLYALIWLAYFILILIAAMRAGVA